MYTLITFCGVLILWLFEFNSLILFWTSIVTIICTKSFKSTVDSVGRFFNGFCLAPREVDTEAEKSLQWNILKARTEWITPCYRKTPCYCIPSVRMENSIRHWSFKTELYRHIFILKSIEGTKNPRKSQFVTLFHGHANKPDYPKKVDVFRAVLSSKSVS